MIQHPNLVTSYQIDRGRQYELDRTDTGRATVQIADTDGVLDPSNPTGPYFGLIEPLVQGVICRYDPVAGTWHQRYRGFVETFDYTFDPSQQVNLLTVSLTDIFEFLSAIEMFPGSPGFGVAPPRGGADQVYYPPARMDGRIFDVLNDAIGHRGRDGRRRLRGRVQRQRQRERAGVQPGRVRMTAIEEAADAEFPGVSNVYADVYGRLVVHGRLGKFDIAGVLAGRHLPSNEWDWHHLYAGDAAAIATATNPTAQLRRFAMSRGLSKIINQAVATPHRTGARSRTPTSSGRPSPTPR